MTELENYFSKFRKNIVGYNFHIETPYGSKKLIYADWTASGRLYGPIEDTLRNLMGPYVANTHSESNVTGTSMTLAYHKAKEIIREHVNASEQDAVICTGSGMTGGLTKLQRMLGYKIPSRSEQFMNVPDEEKPVVFVTHMEHHSNQTTWLETTAHVEIIDPDESGLVDLSSLAALLEKHRNRKFKIASVISCSNVTGAPVPYHKIARMMHEAGGICIVDFAAAAPYSDMNMHPEDPYEKIDAITFSPHKFLGGPGSTGVLVFDKALYAKGKCPDTPGGGTVLWTNPWGEHHFVDDIEAREDGGTPAFLQTIKAGLCIKLKEQMTTQKMLAREDEIRETVFTRLRKIENLHLLANNIEDRLLMFSFYIDDLHYNLGVKLLNDKYGIQVRGGCSCAGTYGHYLLSVTKHQSHEITVKIDNNDLSLKPGWIRLSLHPVQTNEEITYIMNAVEELAANFSQWETEYTYDKVTNYYNHKDGNHTEEALVDSWFESIS